MRVRLKVGIVAWLGLAVGCASSNDLSQSVKDVSAADAGRSVASIQGRHEDDDGIGRHGGSSRTERDDPRAERDAGSDANDAPMDPECEACDGLCFLGLCLGGAPAGPTDPQGDGGIGAGCQSGDDCASGVCAFFACLEPSCGDGVCNGNETAESCDRDCPTRCGDGLTTGEERCDDGNTVTEDCDYGQESCTVCDETCHEMSGLTRYCGDGALDEREESCDDGNVEPGDGCDADCGVEYLEGCGDGQIVTGEACDDGNAENLDGCNGACRIEQGWMCPETSGRCRPICGDGLIRGDEACDDGNSEDDDYCSNDCTTLRACGDGLVQAPAGEVCDDGNTETESCEYGDLSCAGCDMACQPTGPRFCGDGKITDAEACDDGNAISEACAYGATSCDVCGDRCQIVPGATSYCGDGETSHDEQCDDGNAETEVCHYGDPGCIVCTANCQRIDRSVYCGDGRVTGEEACDDGNSATEACPYGQGPCTVCNANCQLVAGQERYCGDGETTGDEQCDDGNTETEICPYQGGECSVCDAGCKRIRGEERYCGDGIVSHEEACDDGNQDDDDGCTATCSVEPQPPTPDSPEP